MPHRFLFAVLLTCLALVLNARDLPGPPTAQERLETARAAVYAGRWPTAIRELEDAVFQDPASADAHNLLGYSYRKQPQPDLAKALEHYRKALALDPAHRGAHEYIAEAYLMDHQPQQAELHLAQLEKLCGNRDRGEYRDLAKAIAAYRKAHP